MELKHQCVGYLFALAAFLLLTLAGCDKNNNGPEGDPPVASFIFSSNRALVGNSISFTDKSTNGPDSWLWIFGDGAVSEEQNPSHVYTAAGAYYVKLVAGNEFGTDTFTSVSSIRVVDTVLTDIQGNTYKVVQIGKQVWMAENLNIVTGTGSWAYNNDLALAEEYGRLYDWETACTVCPTGWHLPSDEEWKELEAYIGVDPDELDLDAYEISNRGECCGGKLKEVGNIHWYDNTGATDDYGFSARGAGSYDPQEDRFYHIKSWCTFWSSTSDDAVTAWVRTVRNIYTYTQRGDEYKHIANPVRCLKD